MSFVKRLLIENRSNSILFRSFASTSKSKAPKKQVKQVQRAEERDDEDDVFTRTLPKATKQDKRNLAELCKWLDAPPAPPKRMTDEQYAKYRKSLKRYTIEKGEEDEKLRLHYQVRVKLRDEALIALPTLRLREEAKRVDLKEDLPTTMPRPTHPILLLKKIQNNETLFPHLDRGRKSELNKYDLTLKKGTEDHIRHDESLPFGGMLN